MPDSKNKLLVIDLYALSKMAEKSFNPSEFNGMGDNIVLCAIIHNIAARNWY